MAIYALSCAPIGYLSAVEISTPRLRQKTSAVAFGSWQGLNLSECHAIQADPELAY